MSDSPLSSSDNSDAIQELVDQFIHRHRNGAGGSANQHRTVAQRLKELEQSDD